MAIPYFIQEALTLSRSINAPFFLPVAEGDIVASMHSFRATNGPFGTDMAELMRKQFLLDYDVSSIFLPALNCGKIKFQIIKAILRDGTRYEVKPKLHAFASEQIENILRDHPGDTNRVFTIDMDNNYISIRKQEGVETKKNYVILVNFDPLLDNYGNETEQERQEAELVYPPPPRHNSSI